MTPFKTIAAQINPFPNWHRLMGNQLEGLASILSKTEGPVALAIPPGFTPESLATKLVELEAASIRQQRAPLDTAYDTLSAQSKAESNHSYTETDPYTGKRTVIHTVTYNTIAFQQSKLEASKRALDQHDQQVQSGDRLRLATELIRRCTLVSPTDVLGRLQSNPDQAIVSLMIFDPPQDR